MMDPDAALDEIRSLLDGDNSGLPAAQRVELLCEYVQGLDDWLSRGGFLPAAWAKGAPTTSAPLGLRCPLCGQPPVIVVGERQAFCGNDDCRVFTWDTAESREAFLAKAKVIDLKRGPVRKGDQS